MTHGDDAALVKQCLEGDPKAFEPLVKKYQKPLFNTALRMVKSYEGASDVTQIVFIKAYENLDRYNPQFKFFSWIYRMLVNESLNTIRRSSETSALSDQIESTSPLPNEIYVANETGRIVDEAVLQLPLEYRMVILFKYFADMSYRDISLVLDVTEKKVRSRLYSARQLLGKTLVKRGVKHDD
jgi:RNA polymerase sigma-70 factor (ECF subfamily)